MQKWKGILGTNNTQRISIQKNVTIKYMYKGVEILGFYNSTLNDLDAALLEVVSCSFINCDYGIVIKNTPLNWAGNISNNTFTANINMLGPVVRTQRGISLYDVKNLTILYCEFENIDNGIYIY